MDDHIVLRDGEPVGYITDRPLADRLDGLEVVVDGMYERSTYTTLPVSEVEI